MAPNVPTLANANGGIMKTQRCKCELHSPHGQRPAITLGGGQILHRIAEVRHNKVFL